MFDKLIENFPKILRALTVGRVAMAIILTGAFTLAWIAIDARAIIIDKVVVSTVRSANVILAKEDTREEVRTLVDRSQLIVGLQLVNVDFKRGVRKTAYFYADHPALQNAIDTALNGLVSPSPLFIKEDTTNNLRLIRLMQAEFMCYETKEALIGKLAPTAQEIAPFMCSISIPPYEGNFSGYLNLFLMRVPTSTETEQLRSSARIIAHSIYDRELR